MHPTASFASHQQRRVGTYRTNSDSHSFFNLLTALARILSISLLFSDSREGFLTVAPIPEAIVAPGNVYP